jgi:tetratricopeptide (TPR) repeat protein
MTKNAKRWNLDAHYPSYASFPALLTWHLELNGTRPTGELHERGVAWTYPDFAALVDDGYAQPESKTRKVERWCSGQNKPDHATMTRILAALFGNEIAYGAWRQHLLAAWDTDGSVTLPHVDTPCSQSIVSLGNPDGTRPAPSLPWPSPYFTGRDEELALLSAELTSTEARHILVQGGPGMGKTELTKAVAHHPRVAARFRENRIFVSLENATTASAIKEAVLRAAGCDPASDLMSLEQRFAGQQLLIVLDNLETPWESVATRADAEQCIATLARMRNVSLLGSFRGRERVSGARWYIHEIERLADRSARQLFAEFAGDWVHRDRHFASFISALGGVPLAISLVARRAFTLKSLDQLWHAWRETGSKLIRSPDPDENRSSSLEYSVALSLASPRLTDSARALFAILGQLPAGMSKESLQAIMGEDATAAEESLLRTGLAVQEPRHLNLLPPIREYARRYMEPASLKERGWAMHYVRIPSEISDRLGQIMSDDFDERTREVWDAVGVSAVEFRNIEAAFRNCLAAGRLEEVSNHAFHLIRILLHYPQETQLFQELATAWHEKGDDLRSAFCLEAAADIAIARAESNEALETNALAKARYLAVSDLRGEMDCWAREGSILLSWLDVNGARTAYQRAQEIAVMLGLQDNEADYLSSLGETEREAANCNAAIVYFQQALTKYPNRDIPAYAHAQMRIGEFLVETDPEGARSVLDEAQKTFAREGMPFEAAHCQRLLDQIRFAD